MQKKKATLQQAWQTCDSQLPAHTLSVYLNQPIAILYTRKTKLEAIGLEGTLEGQLVHPPASGQTQLCINMSCQTVSALRNL